MKHLALFLLIVFFPLALLSQNNKFQLNLDGAFYQYDGNQLKWEMYYSFPDYSLNYIPDGNSFLGKAKFKVDILFRDILAKSEDWVVPNRILSMNDTNKIMLFGIKSFVLAPGQYHIKISVSDQNETLNNANTEFDLVVPDINKKNISIGGIMLATYSISVDSTDVKFSDMFLRFNKYIFPNPSLEIYGERSNINGYAEIYNALQFAPDGLKLTYRLFDATKHLVKMQTKNIESTDDFIFENIDVSFDSINTGVYYFEMSASYPINNPQDSASIIKKVFIVNPTLGPLTRKLYTENELFEKSFFSTLTPEQTDLQLRMAKVIANSEEISQLKLLSTKEAKQRYLFKFWLAKDPDTTTFVNERYEEFLRSVTYANNFLSYKSGGEGWSSERGMVVLRYGIPTERKQNEADFDNRAYEEWFYENVQGGSYFYFVDKSYVGNYMLVHSTARNEAYDPNWFNNYVPTIDKKYQGDENINTNMDYKFR